MERLTDPNVTTFGSNKFCSHDCKGVCSGCGGKARYIKLRKYEDLGELEELAALKAGIDSQEYKAYKLIKDEIKGCLDREREKDKRIAVLERALKTAIAEFELRRCTEKYSCAGCYPIGEYQCRAQIFASWVEQAEREIAEEKGNE